MDKLTKKSLQTIIDFVEGKLPITEFEEYYKNDNKIKAVLKDVSINRRDTYATNLYDSILTQDVNTPGGALNVHGDMERFLKKKNINYKPTKKYSELYDLILTSQPRWLDVNGDYFMKHIMPAEHNMKKTELKKYLREKIKTMFKYHKKPPSWVQNPEWPINENGPLISLGQIDIDHYEYFHDAGSIYVFHDPKSGKFETILQLY